MKSFLFFPLMFFAVTLFGQDSLFVFNRDTVTDYVVTKCPGISQPTLFERTLNWISVTYDKPEDVIKSKIENEYVRFQGSSDNILWFSMLGVSKKKAWYQVEVTFKDGRYKFDLIELKYWFDGDPYSNPRWVEINLNNPSVMYKDNGKIGPSFKYFPTMIPDYFNNLNESLRQFVTTDTIPSKKDDW